MQSPAFPVLKLSPCEKAHTCCSEVLWLSCGQAESRAELPIHVLGPAAQPQHCMQIQTAVESEVFTAMGAQRTIWTPVKGD